LSIWLDPMDITRSLYILGHKSFFPCMDHVFSLCGIGSLLLRWSCALLRSCFPSGQEPTFLILILIRLKMVFHFSLEVLFLCHTCLLCCLTASPKINDSDCSMADYHTYEGRSVLQGFLRMIVSKPAYGRGTVFLDSRPVHNHYGFSIGAKLGILQTIQVCSKNLSGCFFSSGLQYVE